MVPIAIPATYARTKARANHSIEKKERRFTQSIRDYLVKTKTKLI